MVILYSDDYDVAGSGPAAIQIQVYLAKVPCAQPAANFHYREMVGPQRLELAPNPTTLARRMVLHQVDYCLYIVEDYERRFNGGRRLRGAETPACAPDRT